MTEKRHRGMFPVAGHKKRKMTYSKNLNLHIFACKYARHQETSLCVPFLFDGSYTVEAAVVFPLFICLFVTMLFFMRVLSVEIKLSRAMNNAVRRVAILDDHGSTAVLKGVFLAEAAGGDIPVKWIKGSYAGLNTSGSSVSDTDVKLVCSYSCVLPTGVFKIKGISIRQEASARRWVGWNPSMEKNKENLCYVTEHGKSYHMTRSCHYLSLSIRSVSDRALKSARNKSGARYKPCGFCRKGKKKQSYWYVTDYGTNYHSKIDCPGLKRTLNVISVEEAKKAGYKKCGKCGG